MITLGLTGGIGSGKSTVSEMLARRGALIFDADVEAKEIMASNPEVRRELIEAFGQETFDDEGQLDRAYLASRVFASEEEVARINAIVHPRVHAAFEELADRGRQEGKSLVVYEAALIFESGADELVDAVAVVDAPEETRIARSMARDGSTREQVMARMRHQVPAEVLRDRADYLIDNSGNLRHLETEVNLFLQRVLRGKIE